MNMNKKSQLISIIYSTKFLKAMKLKKCIQQKSETQTKQNKISFEILYTILIKVSIVKDKMITSNMCNKNIP